MAEQSTFIKLDRNIMRWRWWSNHNTLIVFLVLLLKANYKEADFEGLTIQRGQLVTSLPSLANYCNLSTQSVRTSLKHLALTGEITDKKYPRYRIITILNYDRYQESTGKLTVDQQADLVTKVLNLKKSTGKLTGKLTGKNDAENPGESTVCEYGDDEDQQANQQANQQAANRQLTGDQQQYKKYKNNKNEKNKKGRSAPGRFAPNSPSEKNTSHIRLKPEEGTVDDIPDRYRDMFDSFADYWRYRNQ